MLCFKRFLKIFSFSRLLRGALRFIEFFFVFSAFPSLHRLLAAACCSLCKRIFSSRFFIIAFFFFHISVVSLYTHLSRELGCSWLIIWRRNRIWSLRSLDSWSELWNKKNLWVFFFSFESFVWWAGDRHRRRFQGSTVNLKRLLSFGTHEEKVGLMEKWN